MLRQRIIVAIVLIPVGLVLIALGGWVLAVVAAVVLGVAAWEYWRMFAGHGYAPSLILLTGGSGMLALSRQAWGFDNSHALLTLLVLLAMARQVVEYERGRAEHAAQDFSITLGGILYIGWLGSYILSLRALPDGMWWLALVMPAVLTADGAAYFAGRWLGRHKISPRTSPKKSWEGYIGGVLVATLFTGLLALLWNVRAPAVTVEKGLIIGAVIAITSLMGDLGESMIKRTFGVKDSSHIIPGHGGVFDRIDSWLWAMPVGYYLITTLWM